MFPTSPDRKNGIKNEESRIQVEALAKNAADFGIEYFNEVDLGKASSISSGRSRGSRCRG